MNIILSFEAMAPCIEVSLPDDIVIFDTLARIRQAVREGKRQVVHILLKHESAVQFPRHGIIEFNSMDEVLYVDAEGPWWLYARHTRVGASTIALEMICDVVNVLLTVDTVLKE
jgi:hypothetical protein